MTAEITIKVTDFSALGRAVWDETMGFRMVEPIQTGISVLSVEPYGMKHSACLLSPIPQVAFQCSRSSRMG